MWNVSKYTETGTRNKENGLKCQDYICEMEAEGLQAITLADGTGDSDLARLGAKKSCETLARLLTEHFEELYDMEKSLVQFHIITNIQSELYDLCEKWGVGLESLHSTLLGLVIDLTKNRFLAVHLGDGCIGIRRNERLITMSYPENGADSSRTYLTSGHGVGRHIRVYRGDIRNIKEFILLSDGWNEKTNIKSPYAVGELLSQAKTEAFTDDISFIALDRESLYNNNRNE